MHYRRVLHDQSDGPTRGAVSAAREVSAGRGLDVERGVEVPARRVLRVRWCSSCGTWYAAYYRPEDLSLADHVQHFCEHCCRPCEFLDHRPRFAAPVLAIPVCSASRAFRQAGQLHVQQELGL